MESLGVVDLGGGSCNGARFLGDEQLIGVQRIQECRLRLLGDNESQVGRLGIYYLVGFVATDSPSMLSFQISDKMPPSPIQMSGSLETMEFYCVTWLGVFHLGSLV